MRKFPKRYLIVLILALGLILRLISLNQSFWLDEATSANVVKNLSFKEIVTGFSPNDFHPPLYYFLLRGWAGVFGISEIGLRMLSVVFGIGTIYFVYLIAKEILPIKKDNFWGYFPETAALLLATSGLHIYYSQEARMYVMATFLVGLTVFSFVKTLKKRSGVGWWVLFSLSLAFSTLTHYLMLFMIPVFWIFGFLTKFTCADRPKLSWWKKFFASHIILGLLWLPWFPYFLSQISAGFSVKSSAPLWWKILGLTSLKELLLVPIKFSIGRIGFDNRLVYFFVAGFPLVLFGYLIFRSIKELKREANFYLIWLWLLVPVFLAAILGLKLSVFSYFRLIFVLPAFYILISAGVTSLSKKWAVVVFILALFLNISTSGIYLFNSRFHREDWRGVAAFIRGNSNNFAVIFRGEANKEAYRYYDNKAFLSGPGGDFSSFKTLWLLNYLKDVYDPNDEIPAQISSQGFKSVGEYSFQGLGVEKYENNN